MNPPPTLKSSLARPAAGFLVCIALFALLAGCDAARGSGDRVRLVVTPVDTPTATPVAAPTAAPVKYTVKAGDTLSGIASLFGVSVDDIVRANNISDPNMLSEGQVLTIPARPAGGTPAAEPAGTPSPEPATPDLLASPTLPPPDVTPPLGPTTGVEAPGASSSPGPNISPTAEP
jgi:LysM repeat protein